MKMQLFQVRVAGFGGYGFRTLAEDPRQDERNVRRFLRTLQPVVSVEQVIEKSNEYVREIQTLPYTGKNSGR